MDQKALGVICIFYFIKTVHKDKFELRNISFLSPTLHACFYGFFCFLFTYSICYPLHNGQWNEKQQTSKIFKYLTLWYYETIFSKNSAKSDYSKKTGFKVNKTFWITFHTAKHFRILLPAITIIWINSMTVEQLTLSDFKKWSSTAWETFNNYTIIMANNSDKIRILWV